MRCACSFASSPALSSLTRRSKLLKPLLTLPYAPLWPASPFKRSKTRRSFSRQEPRVCLTSLHIPVSLESPGCALRDTATRWVSIHCIATCIHLAPGKPARRSGSRLFSPCLALTLLILKRLLRLIFSTLVNVDLTEYLLQCTNSVIFFRQALNNSLLLLYKLIYISPMKYSSH